MGKDRHNLERLLQTAHTLQNKAFVSSFMDKEKRQKVVEVALAVLLAFVPWGQGMLDQHPCWAWAIWIASYVVVLHVSWSSFWKTHRFLWSVSILVMSLLFIRYAYKSIEWRTRPPIVFLEPGVALNYGEMWTLHTKARITRPLFNLTIIIDDQETIRSLQNEQNQEKVTTLMRGSHVKKTVAEVDPEPKGEDASADYVIWRPLDRDKQEYSFSASFRSGEKTYVMEEILKIRSGGYAMQVRDYDSQRIVIACRDAKFPADSQFGENLPPCFPHYPAKRRFSLLRCFD